MEPSDHLGCALSNIWQFLAPKDAGRLAATSESASAMFVRHYVRDMTLSYKTPEKAILAELSKPRGCRLDVSFDSVYHYASVLAALENNEWVVSLSIACANAADIKSLPPRLKQLTVKYLTLLPVATHFEENVIALASKLSPSCKLTLSASARGENDAHVEYASRYLFKFPHAEVKLSCEDIGPKTMAALPTFCNVTWLFLDWVDTDQLLHEFLPPSVVTCIINGRLRGRGSVVGLSKLWTLRMPLSPYMSLANLTSLTDLTFASGRFEDRAIITLDPINLPANLVTLTFLIWDETVKISGPLPSTVRYVILRSQRAGSIVLEPNKANGIFLNEQHVAFCQPKPRAPGIRISHK